MYAPVREGNTPTCLAPNTLGPLSAFGVGGLSAGLFVEAATTMAPSRSGEWDKTPVRPVHAPPRCLLKWEVHLSLGFVPLSFLFYHVFLKRDLFNGPLQWPKRAISPSEPLSVVAWLNLCAYLCVCVCRYVCVRPQHHLSDGWSCQLFPTQQGPSDMRAPWTFWRECEDAGMPISYPSQIMRLKRCHRKMAFQPFLLQKHPAESIFLTYRFV